MTDHITTRGRRLHKTFVPDAAEVGNWAARCNVANQEAFLFALASQAEQPIEVIAERLDISVEEVQEALSGKVDLTMTEVRLLGIASDVIVTYQVRSARRDYRVWLSGLKHWTHAGAEVDAHDGPQRTHAELNPSAYGRRVLEATG